MTFTDLSSWWRNSIFHPSSENKSHLIQAKICTRWFHQQQILTHQPTSKSLVCLINSASADAPQKPRVKYLFLQSCSYRLQHNFSRFKFKLARVDLPVAWLRKARRGHTATQPSQKVSPVHCPCSDKHGLCTNPAQSHSAFDKGQIVGAEIKAHWISFKKGSERQQRCDKVDKKNLPMS